MTSPDVAAAPTPTRTQDGAPSASWQQDEGAAVLVLSGNWQGHAVELPSLPPGAATQGVQIDASGLTGWDARLASALWQLLTVRRQQEGASQTVDLHSLPQGLQQILSLALPKDEGATAPAPAAELGRGARFVRRVGEGAQAWWQDARLTLAFIGDVLLSVGRLLRGRTDMRWSDLLWQIDQTGPRSVPIVSLVSLMVGLILAYMGAAQLQEFGAKSFIADLMTVSVVREIAALLTGIILAGRVGAAFAAQLGSMRANDELDALRTMGIDPIDHLVLPRALALLLVSPLLTAYAALMGLLVGWGAAVALYDVAPVEYLLRTAHTLDTATVCVGLLKGTVYGVLVALAGCRQGLYAGKSAQAVGDATTQSVVKSIVWIVTAASVLTVVFQRLAI